MDIHFDKEGAKYIYIYDLWEKLQDKSIEVCFYLFLGEFGRLKPQDYWFGRLLIVYWISCKFRLFSYKSYCEEQNN